MSESNDEDYLSEICEESEDCISETNSEEESEGERDIPSKREPSTPNDGVRGGLIRHIRIAPEEEHITSNAMTRYEAVRLISTRAAQLAINSKTFIKDGENMAARPSDSQTPNVENVALDDPIIIARAELFARRIPLKIQRVLMVGGVPVIEEKNPRKMAIPPLDGGLS